MIGKKILGLILMFLAWLVAMAKLCVHPARLPSTPEARRSAPEPTPFSLGIPRWSFALTVPCLAIGVLALSVPTACNDVCAKTAASRMTANVLVDDAELSLSQAETVIAKISNQEVRDRAVIALGAARAALRAAVEALKGVNTACESPDMPTIFAAFREAWSALAPFLSLLGGPSAGQAVQAPLVVQMGTGAP